MRPMDTTPNLDTTLCVEADRNALLRPELSTHKPRILLLHGSLRPRSFSRLVNQEAALILEHLGLKRASTIRPDCLCRTMRKRPTPRCRNCARR